VTITALPARHFPGRSLFNQGETLRASFAFIGPKHRASYCVDSGEWDGLVDIGRQFGPFDLTMLEIDASLVFGKPALQPLAITQKRPLW